jgi:hypothetical protein
MLNRSARAIPFLTILVILGGWSVGFYTLQELKPELIPDSLRCLVFFGGLLLSISLGALIGSYLKRLLWKNKNHQG